MLARRLLATTALLAHSSATSSNRFGATATTNTDGVTVPTPVPMTPTADPAPTAPTHPASAPTRRPPGHMVDIDGFGTHNILKDVQQHGKPKEVRAHVNIGGRRYPYHRAVEMEQFAQQHKLRSCVWVTEGVVVKAGYSLTPGAVPFTIALTKKPDTNTASPTDSAALTLYNADFTTEPLVFEAMAFRRTYGDHRTLAGADFSQQVVTELLMGLQTSATTSKVADSEKIKEVGEKADDERVQSREPTDTPAHFGSNIWATPQQLAQLPGVDILPGVVPIKLSTLPNSSGFVNADQTTDPRLLEKIASTPTPITIHRGRQPFWLPLAALAVRSKRPLSHVWGTAFDFKAINVPLKPDVPLVEVFVKSTGQILELANAIDSMDVAKVESIAAINVQKVKERNLDRHRRQAEYLKGTKKHKNLPSGSSNNQQQQSPIDAPRSLAGEAAAACGVSAAPPPPRAANEERSSWH